MSLSESIARQPVASQLGSPGDAVLPAPSQAYENNNTNNTHIATSNTAVQGGEAAGAQVRVHDARLYTELLDACDWTAVLRRERRARRKELLSIHNEEEAKLRAQRDALQRKAHVDAEALRAARKKREAAAKAEREEALFARRMQRFFARHRRLIGEWAALGQSLDEHQARVREKIYELWEQDVFLPIQREINAKVEAKCASDSRPHRRPELRGFDETLPSATAALHESHMNDDALFAQHTMQSATLHDMATTNNNNHNTLTGNASYSARRTHENTLTHRNNNNNNNEQQSPQELTWKEKKDALWRSFLAESNRLAKAHPRGGLSLHVIDAVEYDPVAQCEADTIYYKARPAPLSSVDAQRVEAQRMEETYTRLALAYRDAERHSRTGVLSQSANAESHAVLPLSQSGKRGKGRREGNNEEEEEENRRGKEGAMCYNCYSSGGEASGREYNHAHDAMMGNGEEGMSATQKSGLEQGLAAQMMYEANNNNGRHTPRAAGRPSESASLSQSHRLTLLAEAQQQQQQQAYSYERHSGSHDAARRQTALPSPAQLRLSAAGQFSQPRQSVLLAAKQHGSPRTDHIAQHASDVREMKRKWTLAMGEHDGIETYDQKGTARNAHKPHTSNTNKECEEDSRDDLCLREPHSDRGEVMPLPLNVNPAELHNPSSRLLPWLDLPNVRAVRPREDQLAVEDWDARKLHDTIYGRYVTADGEQRPSCARRKRDGAYMVASDVVFDHFNFPRVAEEPHFGKRMY